MSNKTFARILAGLSNVSETACEAMLDNFGEAIKVALESDNVITLKGCMTIRLEDRAERHGRDLHTGAPVIFPATKTIMCRINPDIKKYLKRK